MDAPQQCIGPYVLLRNLGSGSTSKIKLAMHKETKSHVAIKIINKDSFKENPSLQTKVQREIALMRLFDHPHILKLVDILESPRHLYIGLEYASGGELFNYVVAKKHLDEAEAMHFFRQIVFGLEYLHSLGICHRDMKPENLLLDERNNIKIADFGFARFTKTNVADTSCGSPHYVAPEVIGGGVYDGRRADVWSCGVILYALLTGVLPFDDPSVRALLTKVRSAKFIMPNVSQPFQDLLSCMLTKNPSQRITIPEIKNHMAFRIGLPRTFIQPTPLPLPSFSAPVDLASVTPDLRDILMKIGYESPEELNEDLTSQAQTMAKVFFSMLTTRMMLDQLNWDKCVKSITMTEVSSFDSLLIDQSPMSNTDYGILRGNSYAVNDPHSFANPAEWTVPLKDTMDYSATKNIPTFTLNVYSSMQAVQLAIMQLHMQWFYPDEKMIICRENDKGLYVVAQYNDEQGIMLQLCQGTPENFSFLCFTVEDAIAKISQICEEEE